MMTLNEIKAKLEDLNLSAVSRKTGISYTTLFAIKTGSSKNPSYETVAKLAAYFEGKS